MADIDHDHDDGDTTNTGGLTSSATFPALVALWFAALFGGGCLFLPPVLFDAIFGGQAPFGEQTRIVFALGAAGIGLLLGLFIAHRVRSDNTDDVVVPAPKPSKKSKARPPLDVRAALGLGSDDTDEETDEKIGGESLTNDHDLDLTDEVAPPIDDPHFASAWSDSDAYEARLDDPDLDSDTDDNGTGNETGAGDRDSQGAAPLPENRPEVSLEDEWDVEREMAALRNRAEPSRYNPFGEFVTDEGSSAEPVSFDKPAAESWSDEITAQEPSLPQTPKPSAPPPPPAWPEPRAEEPALTDLGVAELVERLARALQGQDGSSPIIETAPPREGTHRHESALAPDTNIDRAMRSALDRLSRLNDVA